MRGLLVALSFLSSIFAGAVVANQTPQADHQDGASLYYQYCVLCHGPQGMGEGVLAMGIKQYPNTNLVVAKQAHSFIQIEQAVKDGGSQGAMSELSPPWQGELTDEEIRTVSQFVVYLREDPSSAAKLIEEASVSLGVAVDGRLIYQSRCALCHGATGKGDGKMARVVKNPPPFDLTQSVMPAAYLQKIILQGGGALGRSPQMPPWSDTLSQAELEAVTHFILTLRMSDS